MVLLFRAPDLGKAMDAAEKIFELLNRKPMINNESKDGDEIVSEHYKRSLYITFIL